MFGGRVSVSIDLILSTQNSKPSAIRLTGLLTLTVASPKQIAAAMAVIV
jgi:hypothetical protein